MLSSENGDNTLVVFLLELAFWWFLYQSVSGPEGQTFSLSLSDGSSLFIAR
jgi:hypothetical protein